MTAEGKLISLAKEEIEQRRPAKSAMPDDLTKQCAARGYKINLAQGIEIASDGLL